MMVKPTVQELLKKAKNRYELVIATSKRARQIASGAEVKTKVKEESPVTLAANEIAEGEVEIIEPDEAKEEARNFLKWANLDEYTIYPDIVGMAQHIKRKILKGV